MKRFEKIMSGGLYRSRNGAILGVCRGIAEYFDFSVFWARAIAVLLLLLTGFWPITGLYFLAALLMKPEPVIPIHSEREQEFYDSYVHSRKGAIASREGTRNWSDASNGWSTRSRHRSSIGKAG